MRENNDLLLTVIKKMINNRWMVGCLLIGFILAVAMVCSIPLYTNGILQKMLTSDLEMYQTNLNVYPGNYEVKTNLRYLEKEERLGVYTSLKKNLYENLLPEIPLPTLSINEEITIDSYEVFPAVQREEKPRNRYVSFTTIAEMEKHININHGRLYSSRVVNDTIEVIVTENFLRENDFFWNGTYATI